MEMFFIIAPCLYLVNITVAALFVRKYKDPIYKKNLYFWISYLIFGISQAIAMKQQINLEIGIFIWTFFVFVQFSCQSLVITDLFKINNFIKQDVILFIAGALTSVLLLNLDMDFNISIIPVVFFTAWPTFKHITLFKHFRKNIFTTNGFLICAVSTSIHVLDYAYAANKPELIFPGYLFALILVTGVSAFSFATLIERALIQVEMKDMLYNTSRLAALGGMAGEISHEINNPLTVVLLNNDQIKNKLINNKQLLEEDKNYFLNKSEVIDKMSRRIQKIINSLRSGYRSGDHDNYVHASLVEILEDTRFLCEIKANKLDINLKLNSKMARDIKIYCRPVQVTQILQNLILNATDQLENIEEKWIDVSFDAVGKFIEIKVVDSGSGITVELQDKIFEPLFTTKRDNLGTGLGLSISKRLAEEHGGYLKLKSGLKNTTFILGLPV